MNDDDDIQDYVRSWVGLTESEKSKLKFDKNGMTLDYEDYAEAIEEALRKKNS